MNLLMIKQFLRTKTCQLGLVLILTLGLVSIIIGKQFLDNQQKEVAKVVEKQADHIARNIKLHSDDLGLFLYYQKFSLVKELKPIMALSIGQNDLNPSIQSVKILTLEGQKYDTDLVNPTKLLFGNLDFSFILVYVLPLLIIAFSYNLLSEEEESGTWRMVSVTVKSRLKFLLSKLLVRLIVLLGVLAILFIEASIILNIPWDNVFLAFFVVALLYQLFWFALSLWIISLKKHSSFNAVSLLSIWLILVVLLPAIVNDFVINKYPVPEALNTMIQQRDAYHQKWDTNKRETMDKFYKSYPQFEMYGYPSEQGFSWLWYYAMQHLGDAESSDESQAMRDKIIQRQETSSRLGRLFPPMHVLLTLNDLAETSLTHHLDFLQYMNEFHEYTRLYFYSKIFSQATATDVDWSQFKPTFYTSKSESIKWFESLMPLVLLILLFVGLGTLGYSQNFKNK